MTAHGESDQAVSVGKAGVAFCRPGENDLKERNDENPLLLTQFDRITHSYLARSFVPTVSLCEIGWYPSAKGHGLVRHVEAPLHYR